MSVPQHNINQLETLYRLGTSYTGYRLLLALGLFFILLMNSEELFIGSKHPVLYAAVCGLYATLCIINFLTFRFYNQHAQLQFFIYLIIDTAHLSLVLYLSAGPNIILVLLFMMVVLAATMLLRGRQALILTLACIIAVIYQQLFSSIVNTDNFSMIGASSLITLVFLSTYALGKIAVQRLQLIESIAVDQRKALLQLQQINQSIIEQLDTGFLVLDEHGFILTLNDAAKNLLELSDLRPITQQNLFDIQPPLYQELSKYSQQHFRGIFQLQINQNTVGISVQYRPITTQHQQLTLLIIESADKVNQQVQQLKLASIGQLSASIAHEIRNPLAAISQANELLYEEIHEDQHMLSQMIQKQCLRINRTIDDTLNMSRQNQTIQEVIPLYEWLKDFIYDDLKDIEQYLNITIESGVEIYFDPHQLRLVLINLIRNAIRHGHESSPQSQVDIKAHFIAEMVFIDIIDQGTGVSEKLQRNLFEPFHSTATNGTGLGLYLSKTFCEANHARLKYISQTQGACFRIECLTKENA